MLRKLVLLLLVSTALSINRPVYKIVLTQKGFAQFLQYDIETPPIREFTFCSWIRVYDLSHDQSIFTYVANGNNRVLRLWLDTGGRHINISINGRRSSSVVVNITIDTWRHVCFSFQSDFGAWALYVDGRIMFCESALNLYGYVLPAGGSVIIGYGTAIDGIPNGYEGEIFGANMILTSTIERNYTIKRDPQYRQKSFHRNKVMADNDIKYIVLDDMSIDMSTVMPQETKFLKTSYVNIKNLPGLKDHEVDFQESKKRPKSIDISSEKEIFDYPENSNNDLNNDNGNINFWSLVNDAKKIRKEKLKITEISGSGTRVLPAVSEFETPPPVSFQAHNDNVRVNRPPPKSFYDIKDSENKTNGNSLYNNANKYEVSEFEIPPSPEKTAKIYGQWTSSQFANSVLNYIKNINLKNRERKKIPSTIPLLKLTDSDFPYASNFKITKIRPSYKYQKRKFMDRHSDIHKREIEYPQINVKILRNDLRSEIIEDHAKTKPTNIEIINRGAPEHSKEHRFYRNIDKQVASSDLFSSDTVKPLAEASIQNIIKKTHIFDSHRNRNLMTIMPFLKSAEYFIDGNDNNKITNSNDMYTKTLSNANKWHNVKSYSNDYTPRQIDMESGVIHNTIEKRITAANKKPPSVRLKYMPANHKVVKSVEDDAIVEGRALALEISNLSNANSNSVSLFKYNHGYLPIRQNSIKNGNLTDNLLNGKNNLKKNNFDHHVKLGNALNERPIIGNNKIQYKKSFLGGDENVPDINRYRSEIDNVNDRVPPSLGPKVCKNIEVLDRLLYLQVDGSIDITHIFSPVREKNLAIEFIVQNYKRCTTEDSTFVKNPLLFIDWSKTPVRLFGGAYPKKTTDLCGFF